MERRMLLAVALSFMVITMYSAATGQCSPPPKKGSEPATEAPPDGTGPVTAPTPGTPGDESAPAAGSNPPAPGPAPAPAPGAVQDESPVSEAPAVERATLQSDELLVTFSNEGAAVESVQLRHAYEGDKKTPLDLIVPEGDGFLFGGIDRTALVPADGAPGGGHRHEDPPGKLRTARWNRDPAAEAATPETDVVYTLTTDAAVWTKRWILEQGADHYGLRERISRRAVEGQPADPVPLKVLAECGLLREPDSGAAFLQPNAALLRNSRAADAVEKPTGLPVTEGEEVHDLRLLGARSHYFLSAWYVEKDWPQAPSLVRCWATGAEYDRRPRIQTSIASFFREVRDRDPSNDPALLDRIVTGVEQMHHAWMVLTMPTGADAAAAEQSAVELRYFIGPISRHVLRADEYAPIKPVITYRSAFDVLADALLGVYDLFRGLLGSAGLGVILMTLVVRGLMMPLSIKNQLGMRVYSRKIAKIKPKLDVLKKRYANNPKRLREEQAKLYREHGVGLPTGCLLMFVQIPIFLALFSCLRAEYSLRNAGFLWIADLGAPDRLIDFGKTIVNLGILKIFSLNLLPLLMVGLSLWQQHTMPKPADEQQAQQMRMMKWLPIFFAVILYNYTAALALYMVFSSAVSITESRIVKARDAKALEEAAAAPA